MIDIKKIEEIYAQFYVEGIAEKWLRLPDLEKALSLLSIPKECIGYSFMKQPIYKISVGNGSKRILIWSQMHGNESTGTRAMLDIIKFFLSKNEFSEQLLSQISFDFIPLLNPDGADLYSRRTAVGIDMNRDFLSKSSVELQILLNQVNKEKYHYLFNLHDQRTIFNVGKTKETATLSFLAPSYNIEQSVNETRQKTMAIIQYINDSLQTLIPGKIGRYTAEFYPRSTGDNFTMQGYPCVLFEAGHYPNDWQREQTRKYLFLAILKAMEAIRKEVKDYTRYDNIPENKQLFLDLIVRNVLVKKDDNEAMVDLGFQYKEFVNIKANRLDNVLVLTDVGDLNHLFGHEEIDAKKEVYTSAQDHFPEIEKTITCEIGDFRLVNGKRII
ncbi:M14 family zinc carboxypeptidase [uncultured Weeksella sp.]|uniref:M14 family zinc carboxypeptidase n=1 Tax=uncultured Weeksella sp. TaxID=1161389 RepID=UPI00259BC781|nr:M14 family zinc carboxypeptidase [uncultured Weeksella sp.]